jgi:hypothetical protein
MAFWGAMGTLAKKAGTTMLDDEKKRLESRLTGQTRGQMPGGDDSANTGSGMKRADSDIAQAKQRKIARGSTGR